MTDDTGYSKSDLNKDEIKEIFRRVDRLPILDDRTAEEIIGYDEFGLPQ